MNANDQTLLDFLKGKFDGVYDAPEIAIFEELGHTEETAANTEVITIELSSPPPENLLASLAAVYLVLCGYDITLKKMPVRGINSPFKEAMTSVHQVTGSLAADPDVRTLIIVGHNDRLASFVRT